jgi:hypothetical protein
MLNKNYRVEGIRCYWNGEKLIQQWSDADCDEVYEQYHASLEEPVAKEGFRIYPNPTDGLFSVALCQGTPLLQRAAAYRITNLMGQTLMEGQITVDNQPVDVSSLPQGMYFVTVGNSTQKLLVR